MPLLKSLPNSWVVKIQQSAIRGTPDILMCLNGIFVALELKATEKSPIDKLQVYTLNQIEKARGVALVVYPENWDEVYEDLQTLAA